jgi:hypothetical protein
MTALLQLPQLSLKPQEEGRHFVPEPIACCRFCKCTREKPCEIYLRHARDGKAYLVRVRVAATTVRECEWFAAGVCNAPLCIEKLVQESREIFWTGEGNPVRRERV